MKNRKCHTIRTVLKSYRNLVEPEAKLIPLKKIIKYPYHQLTQKKTKTKKKQKKKTKKNQNKAKQNKNKNTILIWNVMHNIFILHDTEVTTSNV
jgi:hypothetical protein